jgi:hypothetical protein
LKGHIAVDSEDLGAVLEQYIQVETARRGQLGSAAPFNGSKFSDIVPGIEAVSHLMSDVVQATAAAVSEPLVLEDKWEESDHSGAESDSGDEDYMPEYLKPKEQLQWDCETIVSTYSNLDNQPVKLHDPTSSAHVRRAILNRDADAARGKACDGTDAPKRILLSQKSGLPLGVLPSRVCRPATDVESGLVRENKGAARGKQETKEEKRQRKLRIKEERKGKRRSKAALKVAFKSSELQEQKRVSQQTIAGVAMFKY